MKSALSLLVACILVTLEGYAQVNPDFETDTITTNTLVACSFISDDKGWLADDQGNILKTTNGGHSWSTLPLELKFSKLDFIDELNGFGITSNAAYKTIDGGSNWSMLTLPGAIGSALHFLDLNNGFISGDEVIYKTTNGGTNWTVIATEEVSITNFFFISSSVGIATAHDEDEYQCIWRTSDAGSTWTNVYSEEDCFLNAVWFTTENIGLAAGYLSQPGGQKFPVIVKTDDAGLTWQEVYVNINAHDKGEELLDIRFKNEQEDFLTSGFSESLITIDGGETWHLTYDNEIQELPSGGFYKSLGGINTMYIVGRKGLVTQWK